MPCEGVKFGNLISDFGGFLKLHCRTCRTIVHLANFEKKQRIEVDVAFILSKHSTLRSMKKLHSGKVDLTSRCVAKSVCDRLPYTALSVLSEADLGFLFDTVALVQGSG